MIAFSGFRRYCVFNYCICRVRPAIITKCTYILRVLKIAISGKDSQSTILSLSHLKPILRYSLWRKTTSLQEHYRGITTIGAGRAVTPVTPPLSRAASGLLILHNGSIIQTQWLQCVLQLLLLWEILSRIAVSIMIVNN